VDHRAVARILAAGRVAIGAGLLVAPAAVTKGWAGAPGVAAGGRLLGRSIGVRDLALGVGVLTSLERGEPQARAWVRAAALADVGDALATLVAYRHLPPRSRFGVLALAAGAAVAGFVAADHLD
jgi:hypothetical protein